MIYTVTLNPALDYILSADEIAYGRVNRAKEAAVTFGGKGINQSVMLRNLGVESVALGFAGGYTGLKLRQLLGSEGIFHRLTEISGETRINLKLRAQQETEINAAGPVIRPLELMELTEQIGELLMTVTHLSRHAKVDAEEALSHHTDRIIDKIAEN